MMASSPRFADAATGDRSNWHRTCIDFRIRNTAQGIDPMNPATAELLLALRSPTAGWFAALVCTLDEARQDEHFSARQHDLLRALLDLERIPAPVVQAARQRLLAFEQAARVDPDDDQAVIDPAGGRPNLTLCGSAA
jgi:hypothetical protein